MARAAIKGTYTLDVETVDALERIARGWAVSKSEALRRMIRSVDREERSRRKKDSLGALDELQRSMGMTPDAARRWESRVREERKASSRRRSGEST